MKQLYAVQVIHVAIVLAKNQYEAATVALEDAYKITFDQEAAIGEVTQVTSLEQLDAYGWEPESEPYNSADELTIRQLINRQTVEEKS